jgi:glycosyltransferase involved in cell wall biosynthesis
MDTRAVTDRVGPPDLSVVVPAFNEAESFERTVGAIVAALPQGLDVELVFVNDGSTDGTLELMRKLEDSGDRVAVVVDRAVNGGLGQALASGCAVASGSLVTWVPGDGEYDLAEILPALSMLDRFDVILARRTSRGQTGRSLLSSVMYLLVAGLFAFDARRYCGIFVIDRARLSELRIQSRDVFFTLEFAVRCKSAGARIGYIEIEWRPRRAGRSKVFNASTVIRNVAELLRFRVDLWRRK